MFLLRIPLSLRVVRYFLVATLALGLVALAGSQSAEVRAAVKTALILPEVLPGVPIQPLGYLTPSPLREDITVSTTVGEEQAYLYRPGAPGRYGAVILHLGVNPDPEDATLHRLASALARTGIVAVIPRSPRLQAGDISPDEVEAMVATFQYLREMDYVDGTRIGFAGFCVGASLSALAAADPRIADQVAFVNFFGGYYDTRDVLRAVATHQTRYQETTARWTPHTMTVEIFTRYLVGALDAPQDRLVLERALLQGEAVPDLAEQLSPQGKSLHALLSGNGTAEATDALLASLSPRARATLAQLSPASVAARLTTRVYIMHDRGDTYIPVAESRRLRDALQEHGSPIYTEFSIFQHMHPQGAADTLTFLREAGLLYQHLQRMLAQVA